MISKMAPWKIVPLKGKIKSTEIEDLENEYGNELNALREGKHTLEYGNEKKK